MNNYIAFLKKEFLENARTYKMLILFLVFLIFGIMNPLVAKLTPELLSSLVPEGMDISLPDPSAFDSWAQFFKNISQIGIIVVVIVFSGILGTELTKGTLINMLTKGLSRSAVIMSKYTCMALLWTISVTLSFIVTQLYTIYLFPNDEVVNLIFSVFCLWFFGMFLLALLLFTATFTRNSYGCLLLTGTGAVICMLINISPTAHKYNPISLASDNMALLTNGVEPSSLYTCLWITGAITVAFVVLSVLIFRKRQL